MTEKNYTWIPFFKALHDTIHKKYDKKSLAVIANDVFGNLIHDQIEPGKNCPLIEISPITFLLQFCRGFTDIENYCERAIKKMEIKNVQAPTDFNGIPSTNQVNHLCMLYSYERPEEVVQNQWDLSRLLYENKLNENARIFDDVLNGKCINITYLSNFLYLINPIEYFPYTVITKNESNTDIKNNNKSKSEHPKWDAYIEYCINMKRNTKMLPYEYSYQQHLNREEKRKYSENLYKKIQTISSELKNPDRRKSEGVVTFKNEDLYKFNNLRKEYEDIIVTIDDESFNLNKNTNIEVVIEKIIDKMKKINKNFVINPKGDGDKNMNTLPKNLILYGPPGTGKTYNTIVKAMEIIGIPEEMKEAHEALKTIQDNSNSDNPKNIDKEYEIIKKEFDTLKQQGQIEFITFHQSYSYEEFVEGIKPYIPKYIWEMESEAIDKMATDKKLPDVCYIGKKGIFREICGSAGNDKNNNNYVLIIDEINRGNISKIFGELITLIEEDKRIGGKHELRVTLPYSQKRDFGVPSNLYIIGTMNTADRSIALLDTALRRRFDFEEMPPKSELLEGKYVDVNINGKGRRIDLKVLLDNLNENICKEGVGDLDKDHKIGHAFLINVDKADSEKEKKENLRRAFLHKIYPLLEEYFYDDDKRINSVLGNPDVKLKDIYKKDEIWLKIVDHLAGSNIEKNE